MCGEHGDGRGAHVDDRGSSPHVRGTLAGLVLGRLSYGIIPACAGNTPSRRSGSASSRDHPRMCGEHTTRIQMTFPTAGSSPHVRGTHRPFLNARKTAGIIPACAGNTLNKSRTPLAKLGSSPHVRGTQRHDDLLGRARGIIPACAGNTKAAYPHKSFLGDHPRMCGEHSRRTQSRGASLGSSPHVRGTHHEP